MEGHRVGEGLATDFGRAFHQVGHLLSGNVEEKSVVCHDV